MNRFALALTAALALPNIALSETTTVAHILFESPKVLHFAAALTDPAVLHATLSSGPITVLAPFDPIVNATGRTAWPRDPSGSARAARGHIIEGLHTPADLMARATANRGQFFVRTLAGDTLAFEMTATGAFTVSDLRGHYATIQPRVRYASNGVVLFLDRPLPY